MDRFVADRVRRLECDEDKARFEKFGKIANAKPKKAT
jgi:hypothetical protein